MKKKKLLAALLSLVLLAGTGCNAVPSQFPAPAESSAPSERAADEEDYIEKSLAYLAQFADGDFDDFYGNVTSEFSAQVPKDTFALQWAQIGQMAGRQEEILSKDLTAQDGKNMVQITSVHMLRKLINTFVYDGEGKIAGSFVQFAPLDVEPQSADTWEEAAIQVGEGDKKLNGLLTLPKNVEKPPVMILLQGSGATNMNEQLGAGGNKPFADIAHGLAEQGIATIRYDKRPYAYPQDMANVTVAAEYLDDAKAAVQLALQDERVDKDRILLLGHSQGGMVGPEIVRLNPEIKGFVSMAGTLRRLEDLLLEQTEKALAVIDGLTEEQKKAQLAETETLVKQVQDLDPADTTSVIGGQPAAYWNSLNAIDSAALAGKMEIPVLVLQGEEDFQVPAAVDYPLWQQALSGNSAASFHLYPELNHIFMKGGSKDIIDVTVYDTPASVDAQVILDIADWAKTI